MPSDKKNKMSKKDLNNAKKREEIAKKKKRNQESSDDESIYTDESEEEKEEMDEIEYRKFLRKIFPSKHLNKKIAFFNWLVYNSILTSFYIHNGQC